MSYSEALKFAEGARKKIIRERAEENCFGYPQQGIAKMEYYESGFKELKKRIPDVTEDEIKGFEYDGIYDEYELSPSEYGNEDLVKIIEKSDMIHNVSKIKCVIAGRKRKFNLGGIKMKFEVLEIVNKNNEKAKKEKEDKKLRNRIKRLFNKKQPKRLIFNPNWK